MFEVTQDVRGNIRIFIRHSCPRLIQITPIIDYRRLGNYWKKFNNWEKFLKRANGTDDLFRSWVTFWIFTSCTRGFAAPGCSLQPIICIRLFRQDCLYERTARWSRGSFPKRHDEVTYMPVITRTPTLTCLRQRAASEFAIYLHRLL